MEFLTAVVDVLGAGLTLVSTVLFLVSGILVADRITAGQLRRDPLSFAIAALVAGIAERTAAGLLLGGVGLLRFELALLLELSLVAGLLAHLSPASRIDLWRATARVGTILRERSLQNWPVSLIAAIALASEVTRGLLRPPLSWDSLGYHLVLAGSWLQSRAIFVPFGPQPMNFFGHNPGNGSIWLWWWLAPSHSELWVNLAFLPQLALLALATAAVARQMGARNHLLAGLLVVLTPVVMRYATTQYVDIAAAAGIVAGCYFLMRAGRDAGTVADGLLAGLAVGVSAGMKVMSVLAAGGLVLAAMPILLRRPRGLRKLVACCGAAASLGSFFYLRNLAIGAGPVASVCFQQVIPAARLPWYQRPDTLIGGGEQTPTRLLDTFLGVVAPEAMELGFGPQVVLLLVALVAVPFSGRLLGPSTVWLVGSQIVVQLVPWATVLITRDWNLFSSLRFLDGVVALGLATAFALAEAGGMSRHCQVGIASAIAILDLLQLHTEMTRGPRLIWAAVLTSALLLSASTQARMIAGHRRTLLLCALLACLVAAPLGRFRQTDRSRAFANEYTAHDTAAPLFAAAWGWLDQNGGDGTVAVMSEPGNWLTYPAMGMRLERKIVYANVDDADHRRAVRYPGCDPRREVGSAGSWLRNLERLEARWIYLSRSLILPFPREERWARGNPARFVLRYEDPANLIFELVGDREGATRDRR